MKILAYIILGLVVANTVELAILHTKVEKHTDVIAVLCKHVLTDMLDTLLGDIKDEKSDD